FFIGQVMKCATKVIGVKIFLIKENTGLIYFFGFAVIVVANFRDVYFFAFVGQVVVLPHLRGEFLGFFCNAGFILFRVVISAIAAATIVGHIFIDALAAVTKDAVPIGGEPS
ncbi:MAG: hypothetical protein RLY76_17, partial [Actinomycetota bacterium]